jgi:hypothetical protein
VRRKRRRRREGFSALATSLAVSKVQTAFVFCCDSFVSVWERALGGGRLIDKIG